MWLYSRNKQRGLAILSYLLFAVFLMGAVGAMMATTRWGSNTADKQWNAAIDIVAQANVIRNKLLDCSGNQGNNGGTHPSFPSSTGNGALVSATTVVCPYNSQQLISGTDGVFLPPAPNGFNGWYYYNTTNCVRLDLVATSAATATSWATAMTTARDKLGTTVASFAQTTTANDTLRFIIVKAAGATTCP